jgi:calcium-dependent protein kinase
MSAPHAMSSMSSAIASARAGRSGAHAHRGGPGASASPTPKPRGNDATRRAASAGRQRESGRDVRTRAWLGEWMKDNLGGDKDKKGSKGKGGKNGDRVNDAFADAERVATRSTRKAPPKSSSQRRPASKTQPPPGGRKSPAFDELTQDELRPDFGLRRDLYKLYEVKSLDDEEPIGAGSYGIVRKVKRKSDGKLFALKTIRKAPWRQPPTSRTSVQYYHSKLRNELEVMRKIGSSLSIVYLYDSFEDDDAVHLLMDLCTGGELLGRIRAGMSYSEADAAELVRSVLRTAAQCHSRGIIFRDIKPDNFLFERPEPGSPLKATDFGLAGLIKPGERLARRCGTPSYMAPEVINRNYGEEADVWSCGVVAYQLVTGRLPFVDKVNQRPNAKEVFRAILEDPIDFKTEPWPQLSGECRDLVGKMMERDPAKRITARAALLHPWLQQTAAEAKQPIGGQVVARLQRFSTYGLLKRSVLRLLGDQLRESTPEGDEGGDDGAEVDGVVAEERELTGQFLELFDLLDTSGDKLVEPEELEAGLRKVGYTITTDECKQLLEQLDTTNDGFIDVNEFLAALVDWEALERSSTEYPNWVKRAFDMLDKDGNGTIDAEEVATLVFMNDDEEGRKLTSEARKAVADCIQEADTDGDGLIDFDEFVVLLQMDPTDALEAYEWRVDSSGNGGVEEELIEA